MLLFDSTDSNGSSVPTFNIAEELILPNASQVPVPMSSFVLHHADPKRQRSP